MLSESQSALHNYNLKKNIRCTNTDNLYKSVVYNPVAIRNGMSLVLSGLELS